MPSRVSLSVFKGSSGSTMVWGLGIKVVPLRVSLRLLQVRSWFGV